MGPRSPRGIPEQQRGKFRLNRPTALARHLRKAMTPQEKLLWSRLRNSRLAGLVFTRQFPIAGHFGDFACRSARLIVEVDGSQHSEMPAEDAERTRRIEAEGYRVIRFWNNDITGNMDGVLQAILKAALPADGGGPPLGPLPQAGGEAQTAPQVLPSRLREGVGGGPPLSTRDSGGGDQCP